jgi:glycosyltransferase involved in cell wall biosynthesis
VVGKAGMLVAADDADGWAEAVHALLRDGGRWQALREAGLTQARAFRWIDSARGLLQHYRQAIDRQPRAGAARRPR